MRGRVGAQSPVEPTEMASMIAVFMAGARIQDADRGSLSRVEERIAGQDEHDPRGRHRVEAGEQTEAQPDEGGGDP